HPAEIRVVPMGRKMNPVVMVAVAIDQAGQRGEGQVETVGRMREQQGVTFRRLDGPEIVEFDQEAVGVEERRTDDLAGVVESDRRTRIADGAAWRQIIVPGEFPVLD